jgi:hypothetical protein
MIKMEECRLQLGGNSVSGSRGGPCGRRRGGVIAPKPTNESIELVVSDCPAAANETVVHGYLNVSNPRMIQAVARVELRVSSSPSVATPRTRRRKR